MKLNLCWKTCDPNIIAFFRSLAPDQTENEARFLTEFFLAGDFPIHHTLVKSHFPTVYRAKHHLKMTKNHLLYISKYDKDAGICRTYTLRPEIRQLALIYCLSNNISLRFEKESFKLSLSSSDKVNQVMRVLMSNKMLVQIDTLNKLIKDASDTGRTLEPRIVNDTYTVIKMLTRADPYNSYDKTIYVDRHLKASDYGRIYEIDGGVQNFSRVSKNTNYKSENTYNYDIRSCALSALCLYCKKLNINCEDIEHYILDKTLKGKLAKDIGVSENCWKQCLLSAIFGANIDGLGSIAQNIKEDVGNLKVDEVYARFLTVSKPYMTVIKQWLNTVKRFALEQMTTDGSIVNAVGCKINITDGEYKNINAKQLSSFYLQGLESAFIYDIIINAQNKFKILSYEFDGLVTEGVIPQELIDECKQSSGFTNAILEVKGFT